MKKLFNTILFLAIVVVFAIVVLISTSCESKSGQREPEIKVVIIKRNPTQVPNSYYNYKVKVLNNGTVAYLLHSNLYEIEDTILTRKSLLKF